MATLNRVFLIGNLTRDPELRYVPSGTAVVSFGLAVNTPLIRPGAEAKEDVCFVRIVAWGKQAESCKQYLTKGRAVFVEGRLIYRSWEQDGKTRSTLEVRADRVQFLGGPRREGAPTREVAAAEPESVPVDESRPSMEERDEGSSEEEPPF
ncbi:MAG: single-stranded DNA-binding protein [Candidatus Omnitrophica bacterium]|nr:single-stranded DNA-binding protein [Candidatus Omnitrophota bacterium]